MILFDNTRILHSRSEIAASDAPRHLEGCYMDRDGLEFNAERLRRSVMAAGTEGGETVSFRSLAEGTKARAVTSRTRRCRIVAATSLPCRR